MPKAQKFSCSPLYDDPVGWIRVASHTLAFQYAIVRYRAMLLLPQESMLSLPYKLSGFVISADSNAPIGLGLFIIFEISMQMALLK